MARREVGEQVRRVTAIAEVVWACPLEGWRLGQDDGCDPIATGTMLKIHRRNVRPEYKHGPFALVEYDHEGTVKLQYVDFPLGSHLKKFQIRCRSSIGNSRVARTREGS